MRLFVIKFEGYYLGGVGVLFAEDQTAALAMLAEQRSLDVLVERGKLAPDRVETQEIPGDYATDPRLVYLDTGDY